MKKIILCCPLLKFRKFWAPALIFGCLSQLALAGDTNVDDKIMEAYRAQMGQRFFGNLKASIVGGAQTTENKLAVSSLKKAHEAKLLSRVPHFPYEIQKLILGLSPPNECLNRNHRKLVRINQKSFKVSSRFPIQTQLEEFLRPDGNSSLENLDLSGIRITDEEFAWIVLHFPNLTSINLKAGRITGDGLIESDLEDTGLTDRGVALVSNLKNLTSLNLYGIQITDAAMANIANLKQLTLAQLREYPDFRCGNRSSCRPQSVDLA